jgi:putative serine protease PepD
MSDENPQTPQPTPDASGAPSPTGPETSGATPPTDPADRDTTAVTPASDPTLVRPADPTLATPAPASPEPTPPAAAPSDEPAPASPGDPATPTAMPAGGPGLSGATPPTPPPNVPPVPPQPPSPPQAPASPTPLGRGRRAVAVLAAAGLTLVAATGGAAMALALDDDGGSSPRSSLDATPVVADQSGEPDEPLSQAAATVLPSVVSISFESGRGSGSGSGVVLSEDGQILTNNHVVAQAANGDGSLSVTFSDGSTADAEIVGRDPASDLAVIQAQDVSGLTPATLGSSDDLNVGDTVLAIGSPLGLDGSVTSGIVSAVGRAITLGQEERSPFGPGEQDQSPAAVIDAIQTDAAINPGNSGGALVNTEGEVVGINTAIASLAQGATSQGGNIGVGFAIPIDAARDIAEQLVENGEATHAYLGVSIADTEDGSGALVGSVDDGQPAADAGVEDGDVITRLGDAEVTDAADLTAAVRANRPGDTVEVTYTRDGEEHTVDVTLGELPTD